MGLDSFASRTPVDVTLADEDRAAFEAAQIRAVWRRLQW